MAITKIHAIRSSIQKAVDYICNPDKTEGALLIDSFACDNHTAEAEFLMSLSQGTGQGNKLAFHLIQSFAPGEVDPDTAHEIGEKLAERLLKGNHSYVIATHTDKHSVHNHIIFCAADNFTHKKYYDNKKTYREIRRLSDTLCHEYALSVIEEKTGKRGLSYEEWMSQGEGRSWKVRLKDDIRSCIKGSVTYDDFIMLMKDLGYEIKGEALSPAEDMVSDHTAPKNDRENGVAKYICFKAPGQSHFIRGSVRGLGNGFTKEEIAEAIEKQGKIRMMEDPVPVGKMEDLVKKTAPYNKLIDRSGEKFKENPWLNRWADKKDLQSVAHAYAQVGDTVQLQEKIDKARAEVSDFNTSVMEIDRKLTALKELAVNVRNYEQYKNIGTAYKNVKNKEKFFEAHESQLMIFEAGEREIRAKGLDPGKISYEQVMDGIEVLNQKRKEAMSKYRDVSKELRDMEQQMEMMKNYMEKPGIRTKETKNAKKNRNEHGGRY